MRSIRITMLVVAVAGVGAAGGAVPGTGRALCAAPLAGSLEGAMAASAGLDTVALDGDRVIVVDRRGERRAYEVGARGVLRHLAVEPGVGLAFVDDVAGRDDVVVATASGVERLRAAGEATHPDLSRTGAVVWAEDMAQLRLRPAGGGEATLVPPPRGAAAVFSPAFDADGSIVAVAQEAVDGVPVEIETATNVWRLDRATDRWTPLTRFEGTEERWSAVRTPVVGGPGEILVVRISGEAAATRPPRHELWRIGADGASKIRDLAGERFLAGVDGDRLLWNVEVAGEWRVVAEGADGVRDLGCGRVMVDPVSEPDPDLVRDEGSRSPPVEPPSAGGSETPMAVVVGDFASRPAAAAVLERLDMGGLRVIDHDAAPGAVAPGAFAVALPLPPHADLEAALDAFRARFPQYVDRSWVSALG